MTAAVRDDAELTFTRPLPMARAAARFARQQHAGQRRAADGAEFLLHPLEVASLLEHAGAPDHVVAAGVLHDVIEDTDVDRTDLQERFGTEVADLVALVSDDPAIQDEERRKDDVRERVRHRGGYGAIIYAADKVSKVRELRMLLAREPARRGVDVKLRRHRRSLEMLEHAIPGNRLVDLLRSELDAADGQSRR
jgi:(p)ppGpp synthase/HD superfamily hydrolase